MSGKLSDTKIKNLKPGPKLMKHAGGSGLTLVIAPSGGKNWWFRYRFEGKASRREDGYAEQAIDDIQGRLKKHIVPALGPRPLGEITPEKFWRLF